MNAEGIITGLLGALHARVVNRIPVRGRLTRRFGVGGLSAGGLRVVAPAGHRRGQS